MFLVVSYWKPVTGKETEFEKSGLKVAQVLKKQPGVVMLEEFKANGKYVSVHGYKDEQTYHKLIDDPESEFSRALKQFKVEDYGRWISSERGFTII